MGENCDNSLSVSLQMKLSRENLLSVSLIFHSLTHLKTVSVWHRKTSLWGQSANYCPLFYSVACLKVPTTNPALLSLHELMTPKILGELYRLSSSELYNILYSIVFFAPKLFKEHPHPYRTTGNFIDFRRLLTAKKHAFLIWILFFNSFFIWSLLFVSHLGI